MKSYVLCVLISLLSQQWLMWPYDLFSAAWLCSLHRCTHKRAFLVFNKGIVCRDPVVPQTCGSWWGSCPLIPHIDDGVLSSTAWSYVKHLMCSVLAAALSRGDWTSCSVYFTLNLQKLWGQNLSLSHVWHQFLWFIYLLFEQTFLHTDGSQLRCKNDDSVYFFSSKSMCFYS